MKGLILLFAVMILVRLAILFLDRKKGGKK